MKMKYKSINTLSSLLISTAIILNFSAINGYALKEPIQNNSKSSEEIVLDNDILSTLPERYRKTSDLKLISDNKDIDTNGLKDLNISGSQQFSKSNLPFVIEDLDTVLPIIIFDLRQESHGFINNFPISFRNENNTSNKGLTDEEIRKKEKNQLESIKLNESIPIANYCKKNIIPTSVTDENALVSLNHFKYIRIFATDKEIPNDKVIDSFIEQINALTEPSWIHFHCKEGITRTTTFMIFYDMMKNYNNVSAEDIINRQIVLAHLDKNYTTELTTSERLELFKSFYSYCQKYGNDFSTLYSKFTSVES